MFEKMNALGALGTWLRTRVRGSVDNDAAQYANRVHEARMAERRRVARELHDRLGEVLTVGLRQLDLEEITGAGAGEGQSAIAREVLVEAMRRLRLVTSGLRDEPVTSFEKAIVDFLNRVCADADVHLVVLGDESWASAEVLDEAFLIVREALRNALTHADPQSVVVGIEVTRRELRSWVDDDGKGFACGDNGEASVAGTGLAAMRERAALLGGTVSIISKPGHGTSVELSVPLTGHRHERHQGNREAGTLGAGVR
jgi:signal transduction histidine kinase